MNESTIYLLDGTTGEPVEAKLYDEIVERHLADFEKKWKPWREQVIKALAGSRVREESGHWDWREKHERVHGLLSNPSLAVECCGETQGLMILNTLPTCRIPSQKGKDLTFVEYLETAPWNLERLSPVPRYKGVGTNLINAAIQQSIADGNEGRIGLHSLPQSDGWYRDRCRMTDLGIDANLRMRYFEMTPSQAQSFIK